MFDQPADPAAHGPAPAPAGLRELTPRPPAHPVNPVATDGGSGLYPGFEAPSIAAAPVPGSAADRPGADDSVVARDDHVEGTFTSRGTVHVMGSIKGRIEASRLYVEDGARVEAEAVVDEAVIAGAFTGSLTCRQRLEARPSGRLSGVIETYRVMLHEGASVEGEVRMLPEPGRAGPDTIRGNAHVRGGPLPDAPAPTAERASEPPPRTAPRSSARPSAPAPAGDAVRVAPRSSGPVGNGSRSGV